MEIGCGGGEVVGISAEMRPVAGYRVRSVQTSLEIRVLLPELYYFFNFSTVMKTRGFQRISFLPEMEKVYCLCCFRVSRTPDWVTTVKESFARIVHNL
jgi:hypothetical protein